jgi:hypothetical protein
MAVDVYYKNRFFDSAEFGSGPIKTNIQYIFQPLHQNVAQNKIFLMKQMFADTFDSWLTFGDDHSYKYYHSNIQYVYNKDPHRVFNGRMQPYLAFWFL